MGIGKIAFDAQYAALAEARASVRVGRVVIDRCLCGAFGLSRTDTEQGTYEAAVASIKLMRDSWPAGVPIDGTKIEFMRVGGEKWLRFRVAGHSETDGLISLSVEAEYA